MSSSAMSLVSLHCMPAYDLTLVSQNGMLAAYFAVFTLQWVLKT